MDILTICLCILVLAGVFALVSLGVFLIHALKTLKDVSHLAQHLEKTVSKVNVTEDDINYKMDKLNEPINVVSGIFNKKRSSAGILGTVLGLKNILKKK